MDEGRTVRFQVMMSPSERADLADAAARVGMSGSRFLLAAGLQAAASVRAADALLDGGAIGRGKAPPRE